MGNLPLIPLFAHAQAEIEMKMHRVKVTVTSFLLTTFALCALAVPRGFGQGGQTPQPQAAPSSTPVGQSREVERVFTRRVRLPVTVIDKKGQPVSGLTAGDFLILEDKQPQQIESITDERSEGQPLFVGVLVDTSPSAIAKLKFAQEAAMNFLHTVLRPRKDKAALITFDHEIKLRQDFTDKLDLVDRAVRGLKKPGTHTALYDAVWQFCNENMRGVVGRRALVVISDGDDTYSRATIREAIDIAQRTETTVFAVSTKAGFSGAVPGVEAGQVAGEGDRALTKLCEETGGRAFFTGDPVTLEQSFTKIAKEVRAQYVVTYKPTNDRYDGRFRRIEVKLASRGGDGMKVRAKRGYSAAADGAGAPR